MESNRNNLNMDLLRDNYKFRNRNVSKKKRNGTGRGMRATVH